MGKKRKQEFLFEDVELDGWDLEWRECQETTAWWVQRSYDHIIKNKRKHWRALEALCELTWITKTPNARDEVSYMRFETLIAPAFQDIFQIPGDWRVGHEMEFEQQLFKEAGVTKREVKKARLTTDGWYLRVGFTNYRTAYRNIFRHWLRENEKKVWSLFKRARNARKKKDRYDLFDSLYCLDTITVGGGHQHELYKALSPIIASLVPRGQFPYINGAPHVKELVKAIEWDVGDDPRDVFEAMCELVPFIAENAFVLDVGARQAADQLWAYYDHGEESVET